MARFNPLKQITPPPAPAPVPASPSPPSLPSPPSRETPLAVTIRTAEHTKRKCPIWIAQLTARVERAEFIRILGIAKEFEGYWSNYGKTEDHGFIFFHENNASMFAQSFNSAEKVGRVCPHTAAEVSTPAPSRPSLPSQPSRETEPNILPVTFTPPAPSAQPIHIAPWRRHFTR